MMVLLAGLIGQWSCGPNGCSPIVPSFGWNSATPSVVQRPISYTTSYQVIEPVSPRLQPDHAWHPIEHNGVNFSVWGYVLIKADGTKKIVWDDGLAENRKSYWAAAKTQQAAKAAIPGGVVKPPEKPVEPEPAKPVDPEPVPEPAPPLRLDPQVPQRSGEQDKLPSDRKLTLEKMGSNYGIDVNKLGKHLGYTENGFPVSTKRVENKLEKPLEPRSFVVVIGTPEERKQIESDWKNDDRFRPYRDLAWLTPFDPDDWQVAGALGFKGTGHPTVIVESSNRTVTGRSETYTGPEDVIEGLRRAHPTYNPANDRKLGSAVVGWPLDRTRTVAMGCVVVVAVCLAMPNRRRRKA